MALGKPVIATAYSGNMSFMTQDTSYLVPFELTTVPDSESLYPAGAVWAEPDLDRAAELMRRAFENRSEAAAIGAAASNHVRTVLRPQRTGQVLLERLASIHGIEPTGLVGS
jgi:hypothetical protein